MDAKTIIVVGTAVVTAMLSVVYLLTRDQRYLTTGHKDTDEFHTYEESSCPICFESMNTSNTSSCALLNCGHYLHRKCLQNWINAAGCSRSVKKCPICRSNIRFN